MPSGGRKRKAGKKKGKNGDAHNNNSTHSNSNSSSTHSQGSEDPRSLDDRESDSGEVEREEEEKEEAREEVEAVDYEEGVGKIGNELSEIAEITKEEKYEKSDPVGVDVAKEDPIRILISEDSAPSNGGGVQDKEVVVEEEKSMVAVWEELKALDVSSVAETKPVVETPKKEAVLFEPVESVKDVVSLPKETIVADFGNVMPSDLAESWLAKDSDLALQISDVKDEFSNPQPVKTESKIDVSSVGETKPVVETPKKEAVSFEPVESVKAVVSLPKETIVADFGNVMPSDLAESWLAKDSDLALRISDAKEEFSNPQPVKTESKIVSKDEENSPIAPPVDLSSGLDDFKTSGTDKHLEEKLVAPAVTVTATPVVESVKNKETLEQSDNQTGVTVVNTSSEVDNVKEVETQTRSIDQTLIGSNPLPVRRTSWLGCCGLYEAFSGANR